ncbi:hypothetical protein A3I95_03380 [Candidatus Nomurabacteria bacterium RIFCSPLOWO2_02_FULL_44_12]|uniref:General secretion pathway GspH domain-containing protein n=1 Tax=Candidatus Nomurabacteria bacterium RIFCSPLOWO2_12_FULL_44_11 TaxID=1801796 RepID=A0A1F6Y773_9BACT|nr:MAG: hypothetical protein A3E95_00980 [Candidatus Nomurabacteria bacterium RIFCSPHIGHO2_12_FULL_44_22b]OGJ02186.1 MAG: hypothetical protein A3G53_02230 [Candidatus Nomurabacteria bacterium RIFCSPLOWO2_12_FULL_44_11]OGJ07639.1 MAG: hypothetical protein A3I95_03380 [Candidatus Nomurabacteria bacterium RIFCSPLOWO2_02_FULL_44_12]
MTYIELIVVFTIFSVLTGVSLYSYHSFQDRVDMKALANDIALKAVQAQKDASFGRTLLSAPAGWKPSYGLFFAPTANNKAFIYFSDLNQEQIYTTGFAGTLNCVPGVDTECIEKINITKGNTISEIRVFFLGDSVGTVHNNGFHMSFTRPGLEPTVAGIGPFLFNVDYTQIKIVSPKGAIAYIKIYSSGRIQIN